MSERMGFPQRTRGWFRHAGLYWLPPLLWMAVMFVLSTDIFASAQTGGVLWHVFSVLALPVRHEQYTLLHLLTRKAAHLTEYAILAGLLLRAFRAGAMGTWRWHWALLSFLLVAVHAALDEYHQAHTRYRSSSISDSVLDMTGGLIALTFFWLSQRKSTGLDRHKKECSMRIFVGNLAFTTTEEEISKLFEPYGIVERAQIITDRDTGRSRGFAWIEMPDATEAQAAIDGLQGTRLGGRSLKVNEARPREERSPRVAGDGQRRIRR